ncbi:hypothetical protein [Rubrivivax gelatinosus]|uniref:Uncharacterized protein n=1 Tax=Rubrivivax gelatinosus (strain NBRC 100245 / IL144) TaxID=983917 RepID=I0HY79_RUBGI|nr:hypothetical protein [Rubrivivax gelatinosus]BAL97966.1 hypothetical protein RGE_46330 [Rubrivivax gelatinosus IL144]
MSTIRHAFVFAAAALAAAAAFAQTPAPAGAASAPVQGAGPGMGGGMGGGMGPGGGRGAARWGQGVTPGWALMTPEERTAHQTKMRSMTTGADCRAYVEQHHTEMAARAKERGVAVPAMPRRDPCAGLPG